ncbi:MAG: tRNA pseudouridine(55) synthase TruB [Bacteroidales bacterium]
MGSEKDTCFSFKEGEVLLVNKPQTWTSFQAVNCIKYAVKHCTGEKKIKVGHAGTLDPLASGLLIICTGKQTKQIESYQAKEKEYTGTFVIGQSTPCGDLEKEVDKEWNIDHINPEMLEESRVKYLGKIQQTPPIFSAVKVDGKRAYDYARSDQDVKLKSREIEIFDFEITRVEMPEVDFRVVCSKGTYIRSLAIDFGKSLGVGAYLKNLCRTRIGDFKLQDSWELEELKEVIREQKEKNI